MVGATHADRGLRLLIFLVSKIPPFPSSEPGFHYSVTAQPDIAEVNSVERIDIRLDMDDTSVWRDVYNYTKSRYFAI